MPQLILDGRTVEVPEGATILDAARRLNLPIPTLCSLAGHPGRGACLVCLVRLPNRDRLVPACCQPAEEGLEVDCSGAEVIAARRAALELILGDHQGECLAPCANICPAHLDIPALARGLADSREDGLLLQLRDALVFPAALGYACPAFCEQGCGRAEAGGAVSIRLLHRYLGEKDLAAAEPFFPPRSPATGKRIAILGGGPTGLAAAYHLLRRGHACVLFEAEAQAGGLLRRPALPPAETVPAALLDREIEWLARFGLEIHCGRKVEVQRDLGALRRDCDAVLLALGEPRPGAARAWEGAVLNPAAPPPPWTAEPGLFAAGGCVAPLRQAVRAVAAGRAAAEAMARFLDGLPPAAPARTFNCQRGRPAPEELRALLARAGPRAAAPRTQPASGRLSAEEARIEAERCLRCGCAAREDCKLREYAAAYGARPAVFKAPPRALPRDESHPEIIFEAGKCILCGLCVLTAAEAGEELGLTFVERGYETRVGAPFQEPLAAALLRSARRCAEVCPTGALILRRPGEGAPLA